MEIPIYQADAFTGRVFSGNPAAVCPLKDWLPDHLMQAVAGENNLSETAFLVAEGDDYRIRWFTPVAEVDLCGHATLAAAHVLFTELGYKGEEIRFHSRSGMLKVLHDKGLLTMDFPAQPPSGCKPPPALVSGLGRNPLEVLASEDYFVVYGHEEDILSLAPDMQVLAGMGLRGVIVTAPGRESDFVSRFFAPGLGIPEDPVTGSAHCALTPYWSGRLQKKKLTARQLSRRGGELHCVDAGDRVLISGQAVTYLRGMIVV